MQPERLLRTSAKITFLQGVLIVTAIAAYALALLGGVSRTMAATLLSATALAVLGLALFVYVASRVGPAAKQRLGGRAQAARPELPERLHQSS